MSSLLRKIDSIYLFVEKIKESSHWYSKVLKMPLEIDDDNFALIRIGECELCFHLADSKSPCTTGGSVGYWRVENLIEAAERFKVEGGIVYRGPIKIPGTTVGICQIKDPFGNAIGLQGHYV